MGDIYKFDWNVHIVLGGWMSLTERWDQDTPKADRVYAMAILAASSVRIPVWK